MTKATSRLIDRGGERPSALGGSGGVVRYVSLGEALEEVEGISASALPGFVHQSGARKNVDWIRHEVLLPLAVEFMDRRVVRSDHLETWASAVALLRWSEDFIQAVRPWVGAYLERRFPGVPQILSEPLDGSRPDSFINRVGVWIEEVEFRVDKIGRPPSADGRTMWIESVLKHGGWNRTDGTYVPAVFAPLFIDRYGRNWTVPEYADGEWEDRILGQLAFRFYGKGRPKGPAKKGVAELVISMLHETPRPTYERIRYRLIEHYRIPAIDTPSRRTVYRLARQEKDRGRPV